MKESLKHPEDLPTECTGAESAGARQWSFQSSNVACIGAAGGRPESCSLPYDGHGAAQSTPRLVRQDRRRVDRFVVGLVAIAFFDTSDSTTHYRREQGQHRPVS